MISPEHLGVLRQIYARLNDSGIDWYVVGSLGLALQGVPVEVHDIDISSDAAGVYEIERLFSEFVTRPVAFSATDRIASHLGALQLGKMRVEIMGDVQLPRGDGTWERAGNREENKRFVTLEGVQIPVLSLQYEYQAYLKLGRVEKAEMLRQWLDRPESQVNA